MTTRCCSLSQAVPADNVNNTAPLRFGANAGIDDKQNLQAQLDDVRAPAAAPAAAQRRHRPRAKPRATENSRFW